MNTKPVILILEDKPNWQRMLTGLLEPEGYETVIASSLSEGKKVLSSRIADVAIVDIRLEEGDADNIDGLIFLDELEKYYSSDHTHAIMLSGYADEKRAINALTRPLQLVLNFFLKEDLDEGNLVKEVARAVRSARMSRGDSQERIMRPYLPNSFVQSLDTSVLVANFSSAEESLDFSRALIRILENLLFPVLPLAQLEKVEKKIIRKDKGNFIHFVCWSRKYYMALEVCLGKKGTIDYLKPRMLVEIADNYENQNKMSTGYFDGVVFGFKNISFDEFIDFQAK